MTSDVLARKGGLGLLTLCDSYGPTIVSLLKSASVYADSGFYDAVVITAGTRIEAQVFDYAYQIARDTAATALQRVAGIHLMLRYVSRIAMQYDRRWFTSRADPDEGCLLGAPTHVATVDAGLTPLPPGAKLAAGHLADSLARSSSAPIPVRVYAECLRAAALPFVVRNPWMAHSYEDESFTAALHFEFQVLCGRRVMVRNKSRAWLSLRLVWGADVREIEKNDQARTYNVAPRPADQAHQQDVWQVPSTAALKFRIQQVITRGGIPPYVLLVPMGTLDTATCP